MPASHELSHHRVAIVGAGFGGIGAAIRLQQEGTLDFVILEREGEIGGVWRDNRYPGAACDVESRVYELAAAPNPDWSRRYSGSEEIWRYMKGVVERFGLEPRLRLGWEVERAEWDAESALWRIRSASGERVTADVLVAAPGALNAPRYPDLPGLDTFGGVAMHTARWREDVDLSGKRVAIIGTGASAIQIIPAIQPEVAELTVFQRTPPWVIPRWDRALPAFARALLRTSPGLLAAFKRALYSTREGYGVFFRHPHLARIAERYAAWHMRRSVKDSDLRRRLTPSYRIGCKRILLSDDYYPAITQPNVRVVSGAAARVEPGGVVGEGGARYDADVIVLATGFHVTDMPIARRIAGRRGETLAEVWGLSPKAHLGTTVAGFPNFFLLAGPNTGLGHSSVLLMMEAQTEHIVAAMRWMERTGTRAVEPTEAAQAAFVEEVDREAEGTVWTSGGCDSWYLDRAGRNAALWPGSVGSFRRRVEPFDESEYLTFD
jgi:cation diffusion facilitator CzcD-associated flavoprotein CzcO